MGIDNNLICEEGTIERLRRDKNARTFAQQLSTSGFEWKWAITCNRVLRACGKKNLHPVPEHSKSAEITYWKTKQII